jgi:hypothetical protein
MTYELSFICHLSLGVLHFGRQSHGPRNVPSFRLWLRHNPSTHFSRPLSSAILPRITSCPSKKTNTSPTQASTPTSSSS